MYVFEISFCLILTRIYKEEIGQFPTNKLQLNKYFATFLLGHHLTGIARQYNHIHQRLLINLKHQHAYCYEHQRL